MRYLILVLFALACGSAETDPLTDAPPVQPPEAVAFEEAPVEYQAPPGIIDCQWDHAAFATCCIYTDLSYRCD